jgi:hypothetical protein
MVIGAACPLIHWVGGRKLRFVLVFAIVGGVGAGSGLSFFGLRQSE